MPNEPILEPTAKLRNPKPANSEERWITWEEWRYRAVHRFFDSVAKKAGRKPNPKAWEAFLPDHLDKSKPHKILAQDLEE